MFSRYFTFLALLSAGLGAAQEQVRMMIHPLTDMPDAALDVKTSYYFPKYKSFSFLFLYTF